MDESRLSGYREIAHTADWALEVWAPDMPRLLASAAEGMFSLMGLQVANQPITEKELQLSAMDAEDLLVSFLGELLFLVETENWGCLRQQVFLDGHSLSAHLAGGQITAISKTIKAVTYHKLEIRATDAGLETVIVFDV